MTEMIELHLHIGDKLDSLWQFYISIHLAIIGGLVFVPTVPKPATRPTAIYVALFALWLAYSGFMVINGMGILKTYLFMHSSQLDLLAAGCAGAHAKLCEALLSSDLLALRQRATGILAASWLFVTVGLWMVSRAYLRTMPTPVTDRSATTEEVKPSKNAKHHGGSRVKAQLR